MFKIHKKTYKNGLRALVIPIEKNPTVSVMVMTATGSNYEDKDNNGVSHFLEHLLFKGTVKRPSSKIISEEFENMGSINNAFTEKETTTYFAKGDSKNFSKMLDIISDIYLNAVIPEEEMEKEKGVVLEEINMYEDIPQYKVEELLDNLLYGDQPAGRPLGGTKEGIKKMTRVDILDYKGKNYVASKTVVVVAGKIKPNLVFKEVQNKFKNISQNKGLKVLKIREKQNIPQVVIQNKKTDQTHLSFGFRGFSYLDNKKSTSLSLLGDILGNGMSSRLFLKLREEMGVAYYVSAFNNTFKDHGFFCIKSGVNCARVKEVIRVILEECKMVTEDGVSQKELNRVKTMRISLLKMSFESTDSIAGYCGSREILGYKTISLAERIKEIKEVTPEDIKSIAKKIFKNNSLNLAIVGPDLNEREIRKVCNF
jgi:predicted Zn-dependent peptidase